ncbi:MAG: hypothetical protein ABJJ05_06015, partial [Maribacter litoralis]|uniref:hypothetical protein n=1 Tax=Maribacter litoralis TaxID=2059726 RepID=UPI0032999732
VRCPLSVVRCPLSVVRCPLSVVRCPLSVVRCQVTSATLSDLTKILSVRVQSRTIGVPLKQIASYLAKTNKKLQTEH